MAFEIIDIENGDVLACYRDRGTGETRFVEFVEANLAMRPSIVQEVRLVEVDESGTRRLSVSSYADLARSRSRQTA
jgi:hypothetical protein